MNITNVIVSYYIEVVNIMLTSNAAPYLYVISITPLPIFLAQLIGIFLHCTGSLSAALGSAISCFQIFYVTKFELVFSWDPEKVGQRTVFILAVIISLPHAVAGTFSIFNCQYVDKRVELLTKSDDQHEVTGFHNYYSMFWFLLFIIISFFAFVFIPLFYKNNLSNQINQLPVQSKMSIKRYLLLSLGFLIFLAPAVYFNKPNTTNRLQLPGHFFLFSHSLLLTYRFLEEEARNTAKRYLFNLFHIEENVNVTIESIITRSNELISQSQVSTVVKNGSSSIILPMSPCINIPL